MHDKRMKESQKILRKHQFCGLSAANNSLSKRTIKKHDNQLENSFLVLFLFQLPGNYERKATNLTKTSFSWTFGCK